MNEILKEINGTFDSCMENASDETILQLKIIRNNINTIITNHLNGTNDELPEAAEIVSSDGIKDIPKDGKKVLIVDDSSIVRNYLEKVLINNYQIETVNDGQEAIERLSTVESAEEFALILLDIMMPNVDGFGVLEYMTARDLKIPVIVISGDTTQDTINRAFQYRVADMIEKPFDAEKIKGKIGNVIQ